MDKERYFLADDVRQRVQQLDVICNAFLRDWNSGLGPAIEDRLDSIERAYRPELFQRLLSVELRMRRSRGEVPTSDEYIARFPQHQSIVQEHFATRPREVLESSTGIAPSHATESTIAADCNSPVHFPETSRYADRHEGSDLIGRQIDRFQLVRVIGQGGMGTVYLARHTLIQHNVALKVLGSKLANNQIAVARFLKEAQACVRLVHPHVVSVHDVGIDAATGSVFMTMQLIDGEDLERFVRRNGPMNAQEAVRLIRQVADALQFAASLDRPIVHRDIKPSNVMRDRAGQAKLLDLGLARILGDDADVVDIPLTASMDELTNLIATRMTKRGVLLGTVAYMAPEQARDPSLADCRSDIYSLGCTLHFVLAGARIVPGDGFNEVLSNLLAGNRISLTDATGEGYNESLRRIVEKMTAFDPEERYQTPADLIRALDEWLRVSSEPTTDYDVGRMTIDQVGSLLLSMKLIAPGDWERAAYSRPRPESWQKGKESYVTMESFRTEPATRMDILLRLQQQAPEDPGLTHFQLKVIAAGRMNQLRQGPRVLREQLGATWKHELFLVHNLDEDGRPEAYRLFGMAGCEGLVGSFDQRRRQFMDWTSRIAKVQHPNLETVLESGFNREGIGFLATEYVPGFRYVDRIRAGAKAREALQRDIAEIAMHAALALAALHDANILHLDVTPWTLRFDHHKLKLVGAGIRRIVAPESGTAPSTADGNILGSPQTMAPEQWLDPDAIGPSTDLFSLGAILYHLWTGEFPYVQGHNSPREMQATFVETLMRRASLERAMQVRGIPEQHRHILTKLIDPEPGRRFKSAGELVDALSSISRKAN